LDELGNKKWGNSKTLNVKYDTFKSKLFEIGNILSKERNKIIHLLNL